MWSGASGQKLQKNAIVIKENGIIVESNIKEIVEVQQKYQQALSVTLDPTDGCLVRFRYRNVHSIHMASSWQV